MSKTITITISDDMWQQFKHAVGGYEIAGAAAEEDYEGIAEHHMYQALDRRIKNHSHPETGLTKQQMVHYRRGEGAGKARYFNNKATQEELEEAGRTWAQSASKQEHVRELLLQGWMSAWKG